MTKIKIDLERKEIEIPCEYDEDYNGPEYFIDKKDFKGYELNDILNFELFDDVWCFDPINLYLKDNDKYTLIESAIFNNSEKTMSTFLLCLNLKDLYFDLDYGKLYNDEYLTVELVGNIENLHLNRIREIYKLEFNFNDNVVKKLYVKKKLITSIKIKSGLDFDFYLTEKIKSIRYVIFTKRNINKMIKDSETYWGFPECNQSIYIFEGSYKEFKRIFMNWKIGKYIVITPMELNNGHHVKRNKIIKVKNLDFKNLDFNAIELLVSAQT